MDSPRDYHMKWSKSDRERQISYDVTYTQNLKKKDIREIVYKTEIDSQKQKTYVTKGDSGAGLGEKIN